MNERRLIGALENKCDCMFPSDPHDNPLVGGQHTARRDYDSGWPAMPSPAWSLRLPAPGELLAKLLWHMAQPKL
jgi:hypothetical protein